ncbi:class I SAM-dependent methyltransferase [Lutispora thermophila]|uniref:Putative AdoMet-dependent methyltransferase n=1 Tax=Lutispora thermophila DSM 19022 TaxID=1122184 RepID=A0A1M6BCX8_9FIRM|nr:class I SAM-dependent methyltransferase [Lutispora thermophila]SHI46592.1 putative AdoMet-dependent methyltransferase [Lutispora thermophila DSM 19022]
MLDNKGFDLWANGYDASVNLSEESNRYPFAGYKDVLNIIYNTVCTKEKATVLDIGFGTGTLTKKLYDDGYFIYGIDFSERMIQIAREKMPLAQLFQYDFSKGLPEKLDNVRFDYIISTYAIHHLEDEEKVKFLNELTDYLLDNGEILIGDIAFETRELLEKGRINSLEDWDSEESYIVFDYLKDFFPKEKISYLQVSHCAGIMRLKK